MREEALADHFLKLIQISSICSVAHGGGVAAMGRATEASTLGAGLLHMQRDQFAVTAEAGASARA